MSTRIGFIGVGGIARPHISNLLRMPDVDIVAIADPSSEAVRQTQEIVNKRASQEGADAKALEAAVYSDPAAMLKNEKLDGVYICLPPFAHGEAEEAAIRAGVPMLVEKPVALHLPVANRVLQLLRSSGLWAASGYQLRYAPELHELKKRIGDRTLGMALIMRLSGHSPGGKRWVVRQDMSGGKLVEHTTHQVDLLRFFAGDVQSVYAAGATRINHRYDPDFDIYDVHCVTLTLKSGAVCNLATNSVCAKGSPSRATGIHLFYDGMTVSMGGAGEEIEIVTAQGKEEFPRDSDLMWEEDLAFVKAVAENRPELIHSDYLSGIHSLAVTIAANLSAQTGQPVDIDDLLHREAPEALTPHAA